jgi:hypothetical protein
MEPRDQERFLMSLCNRIRAHFEIFYDAMDRVAIPFGQFVGIFSWKNEVDHIRCERLFEVADRVTEDELTAVNLALGVYTKMAQLPYRRQRARDYPSKPRVVADSVARFHSWLEHLLIESISNQLRNLAPAAFKVAFSTIRANLAEADHDILHEDFADAVVRMEIALTTLHSFNMQLLDEIEA